MTHLPSFRPPIFELFSPPLQDLYPPDTFVHEWNFFPSTSPLFSPPLQDLYPPDTGECSLYRQTNLTARHTHALSTFSDTFNALFDLSNVIERTHPSDPPSLPSSTYRHILIAAQLRLSPSASPSLLNQNQNRSLPSEPPSIFPVSQTFTDYIANRAPKGDPLVGNSLSLSSNCQTLSESLEQQRPDLPTDGHQVRPMHILLVWLISTLETIVRRRATAEALYQCMQTYHSGLGMSSSGAISMLGDYNNLRAIAIASYGDPTSRIFIVETPVFFDRRETLTALPHADGLPPVGLLLSEEEMAEFTSVLYPQPENYFDPSFSLGGHVGATCDFVQTIATHGSYRGLHSSPGQLYTWDKFLSAVGPRDLLDLLKHAPIFMKGVPLDDDLKDPDITDVFSAVLRDGFVTRLRRYHAHIDQGHIVAYFFASSLHRWYVEWKLSEMLPAFPIQAPNILNLVITVISSFSPKRLVAEGRMGPGGIKRPLKALYQDEFNRCCRVCFNGSVVTFPESGITKPGRSDFYIPAHEWGVELVCDGDRIDEHTGRFSQEGSYMTALPLSDYVIVDCRTTCPRDPHPDIQKLYHMLFSHDFHDVSILDNMPVGGGIWLANNGFFDRLRQTTRRLHGQHC